MKYRTLASGVLAFVSAAGPVWADDSASVVAAPALYLQQPPPPVVEATPAARRPLMSLLDRAGLADPLDAARINVYGRIEGSYTYNFDVPARNLNVGRALDVDHNDPQINQLDVNIERRVDLKSHQFDIGGRVELLYGTDSRFIHSSGLLDGQDFFHGPEYQFDIPQIYVDLAVPVGNGLRIRLGKVNYFKPIDPNASPFFSHTFAYGATFPYTLTGVSAFYPIDSKLNVEGGIARGWDQTFKDNNGAIDAFGRVRWDLRESTSASVSFITGPEQNDDNSHYRSMVDVTLKQSVGDNLALLFDALAGRQAGGVTLVPAAGVLVPFRRDANWYGASATVLYRLNEYLTPSARAEWYRDETGYTTQLNRAQNLYGLTIGLTITPLPNSAVGSNLKVRPEIRFDYSSVPYFDGVTRHDQTTAAVDAIFNF